MTLPETRYAKSGDVSIAYQVTGSGDLDLVFVPGFVSNLNRTWEDPGWADFLSRLARFSRLILFDKRGTGLSDRIAVDPDLDARMDDVRAVMDAAGSERAAVFGVSEGGAIYRPAPTLTLGSPVRCRTRVGTRMVGRIGRTSISAFMRISATAAAGLAPARSQRAHSRRPFSSDALLGLKKAPVSRVPQPRSMAST
jgi:pimeloyl-ACP methyl ester carboxylesterase